MASKDGDNGAGSSSSSGASPEPGREPHVHFQQRPGQSFQGRWQDRPMGPCAFPLRLCYYNNSKTMHNSNVLQVILREHGFHRVETMAECNIFWAAGQVDPPDLRNLQPHQRVNKFPKASALTLKANLWSNFARFARRFGPQHFDYMPPTFVLPSQLEALEAQMETDDPERVWILKPAAAYCGRGISLHRSIDGVPDALRAQRGVACSYIDPPYLVNGLKNDVRIYVLVTSWHPLVVYLYEEGLARFATGVYSLADLNQRTTHLTNYSLNKHSQKFVANTDAAEDATGSKWSLSAFRRHLAEDLGEKVAEQAWRKVDDIVVKTAVSAVPVMSEAMKSYVLSAAEGRPCSQCFQVFGFDVMLDAAGRPWLLEVNLDPALRTESPLDMKIKSNMLMDLLNLVGVPATESKPDAPPPPFPGVAAEVLAALSAAAEAHVPLVMGEPASEVGPAPGSAAAAAAVKAVDHPPRQTDVGFGGAADDGGGAAQQQAVLEHVNAEFARSKGGRPAPASLGLPLHLHPRAHPQAAAGGASSPRTARPSMCPSSTTPATRSIGCPSPRDAARAVAVWCRSVELGAALHPRCRHLFLCACPSGSSALRLPHTPHAPATFIVVRALRSSSQRPRDCSCPAGHAVNMCHVVSVRLSVRCEATRRSGTSPRARGTAIGSSRHDRRLLGALEVGAWSKLSELQRHVSRLSSVLSLCYCPTSHGSRSSRCPRPAPRVA